MRYIIQANRTCGGAGGNSCTKYKFYLAKDYCTDRYEFIGVHRLQGHNRTIMKFKYKFKLIKEIE
jgi:hypothetical protein